MVVCRFDEWIDVGTRRLRPLPTAPDGEASLPEPSKRASRPKSKPTDVAQTLDAQAPPAIPEKSSAPAPAPASLAVTTATAVRVAALGLRQRGERNVYDFT